MKTNAITRIIVWSIVIVLLCAVLFAGLNFRTFSRWRASLRTGNDSSGSSSVSNTDTSKDPSPEVLDTNAAASVPSSSVREIEIDWVSGSIQILPADVTEITFTESEVSDSRYAMVWKQKNEKLSIEFCAEHTFSGFGSWNVLKKDLLIQVPRDWVCDSLEVDTASTTLEVTGLTIREVEVDSASGEYVFTDCTVDEFDLDTVSGDVRFTGKLNSMDCDAASASVYTVLENVPKQINMDIGSGDLDITLPEDAGFTLTMDTMTNHFTSEFTTTSRNGSFICGDGGCRIKVDGMSGNVTIRKGSGVSPTGATGTVPTPLPLETRAASTGHTHTGECLTNPDSCPDASGHHAHANADACPDTSGHHAHTDPSSCSDI